MIPLAVVGMSFREGPTRLRAKLLEVDHGEKAPSQELIASGAALGVVRVHTCSRIEWVLSASNPAWAAQLLRGALLSRAGDEAKGRDLHVKAGPAAAHYLARVTLGLEAVAEGESAVGRQVVKAFELARKEGHTDRSLHAAWRALTGIIHQRRELASSGDGLGVQTLVVTALKSRKVPTSAQVVVFGRGEMGKATARALVRAGYSPEAYGRDARAKFDRAVEKAKVVVIASGAPAAWLQLPERSKGTPIVIDVGSPPQLLSAPGWEALGLDELLGDGHAAVPPDELARLEQLCELASQKLVEELEKPPPSEALSAIDETRKRFLQDQLPSLLEGLTPKDQKRLKASMQRFAHTLLERTRGGGSR